LDILDYENTVNPAWWLRQMEGCDWIAGRYLHSLLKEGKFHALCGEKARVLLLADGTRLASFCTYAQKDDVPDTELTPWMGFVYTHPYYRGRRLMGKLVRKVKELAREDGYDMLYISTGETGLYEKYGAVFDRFLKDVNGNDSRIYRMDTFGFYGWEQASAPARTEEYPGIRNPKDLYNALWHVWKKETCAPRMQEDWSEENRTLGQCSITAFLAQDIFGGRVYGVPLGDGSFHCFNVVGEEEWDLTSEQFGETKLEYTRRWEQTRHEHFRKTEKKERYEALKAALMAYTRSGGK